MMRRLWAILCITAIALVSVRPARTIPADVHVRRDVDLFHSFGRYLREKLVHGRARQVHGGNKWGAFSRACFEGRYRQGV
jgi:hypothetical protein